MEPIVRPLSQLSIQEIKQLSLEQVLKAVEAGDIAEPNLITIPLGTATTDKQISCAGNYFGIYDATDVNVKITAKFNRVSDTGALMGLGQSFIRPIKQVYISWTAQESKTITILIASLAPDLFAYLDQRSNVLQAQYLADIETNTDGISNLSTILAALNSVASTGVLKSLGDISTGNSLIKRVRSLDGDTGTQVVASGASNNNTVTIYTVTTGKTLYLAGYSVDDSTSSGGDTAALIVTNAADATQYSLHSFKAGLVAVSPSVGRLIQPAIKIPAGYKIKVTSSGANSYVSACINGWEE